MLDWGALGGKGRLDWGALGEKGRLDWGMPAVGQGKGKGSLGWLEPGGDSSGWGGQGVLDCREL